MSVEIALALAGLGLAALIALRGVRRTIAVGLLIACGCTIFVWARVRERRGESPSTSSAQGPTRHRGAYAGSEACRACHPGEHATFMSSFHRSMTERANVTAVRAPLPARASVGDGADWALRASDDGQGVVAARGGEAPVRVRITTGSHHYQAYWRDGARPGELALLPFVYLMNEQRFVPRSAVFLTPDDAPPNALAWNASCIQCHSVAGAPRRDERGERFETEIAELGIACEACHGPSAEHVARERDPAVRYLGARGPARGLPLQPAKIEAERSTGVCAQCHSLSFPRDEAAFWDHGVTSAAPDRPWDTRILLTYEGLADPRGPRVDAPRESLFWRDGTIRIGGREANGLTLSACFTRGTGERKIACTSCHSMHAYASADDQLARGKDEGGDAACTSCHEARTFATGTHTHHAETSSGARCVACHMPKTTFALLGAIRSHRIERPSVALAEAGGRIPVCNQCHLDKSTAWTSDRLATWYGQPRTIRDDDGVPAAVRWLLSGDAAMRALASAWAGSPAAQAASGRDWLAPLLAERLDDSYAAVRFVAARSLRTLPGFGALDYDYVAPPAVRAAAKAAALARASSARRLVSPALVVTLTSQRDDRAITIAE